MTFSGTAGFQDNAFHLVDLPNSLVVRKTPVTRRKVLLSAGLADAGADYLLTVRRDIRIPIFKRTSLAHDGSCAIRYRVAMV